MVEYKKKKLILQSGGTRNYYYKVTSNGKKKQVSKNEYLEKKGGSLLFEELNTLIKDIEQGKQNRENYTKFQNIVLKIVNEKLEIPNIYKWKSIFNENRNKHFKSNGSKVNSPYPWKASNTWEDSFVTQLWSSLFH
jgi:hypothetical protein